VIRFLSRSLQTVTISALEKKANSSLPKEQKSK